MSPIVAQSIFFLKDAMLSFSSSALSRKVPRKLIWATGRTTLALPCSSDSAIKTTIPASRKPERSP